MAIVSVYCMYTASILCMPARAGIDGLHATDSEMTTRHRMPSFLSEAETWAVPSPCAADGSSFLTLVPRSRVNQSHACSHQRPSPSASHRTKHSRKDVLFRVRVDVHTGQLDFRPCCNAPHRHSTVFGAVGPGPASDKRAA